MTACIHASTRTRRSVLTVAAAAKGGAWMMADTLEDVLARLAMILGDRLVGNRRMAQF